jgi:outer membrane protein TolC
MNLFFAIFLTILFVLPPCPGGVAYAAGPRPAEDLARLIDTALANNPELKASEARWQVYRNRIAQARSLDDPMLMFKVQNGLVRAPFDFQRDSMTAKVIGVSQQIPFWGKRELKGEVASQEAKSFKWEIEERKNDLVRMVKETWYQLYYIDKATAIVDNNIKVIDGLITIAETRYAAGQGVQQDIYKAQVERSKMLDMRISLEQQRKSLEATLNNLLYRPVDTPVGAIPDFDLTPLNLSAEELRNEAYKNRPQFKSLQALIEKGRAGHRLAEKEFYPDFNVSFEYMQRQPAMGSEGFDMYSLGLTFNLPVQRARRHAMVAEATSEIIMATEELNSLKNTINSGVTDLLAQMERRQRLVKLYKTGIIPQADQALESATINYRVGKVDFLTLLDSLMTLFNYEREYYESLADYQMKLAGLEALVGKRLE